MDRETRGLLVGMAFGDAYINVARRLKDGKYPFVRSEMRVVHSLAQADYCEHKASLVAMALNRKCLVSRIKHGPGAKYEGVHFCVGHPYFKQIRGWVYPGGEKRFTTQALKMLTPRGIAMWYMDDGHARTNTNKDGWVSSCSTDIATMCSLEEAELIAEFFRGEYGVELKVRCDKRQREGKQFYLQANTKASHEFVGVVQQHIIPSMAYKVAHVADLMLHECREPIGACVDCGAPVYEAKRKGRCTRCYSRFMYQRRVMR